ncbi:MAG: hypothetical protein JRJ62_14020 [Deltaproteobacteria bacterium]|nr:hypothetical protein [Deltaproteobacteria bacterium]
MEKDSLEDRQSIPLAFRAEQALKEAVADTRAGVPIVVWRYGKVVKVPVDQIEIREPAAEYKNLNEKDK